MKNNKKHKHKDPKKFEKLQSSAQELLIWLIKGLSFSYYECVISIQIYVKKQILFHGNAC